MASINILALCVVVCAVALFNQVNSKKYCRQDSECSHLGEFTCIKSFCEWGVCGCPSNKAAKYVGQSDKFKCVSIKKVGESCSNAYDDGVCGADNSYCNESTGKCTCDTNMVPIWGGERCESVRSTSVGETCSLSSAIGDCQVDNSVCTSTGTYYHTPTNYDIPTCACPNTEYLGLSNAFVQLRSTSSNIPFVHRVQPQCVSLAHGDSCMYSTDCPGGMTCETTSYKCTCTTAGHVPNYDKSSCHTALAFGALCASAVGHCDGSLGLTCGDMCAVTGTNELAASTRTCTCGPYHTMSGTTCNAIAKEGTCNGDWNCKSWSMTGVCVDNKCVEGAGVRAAAAFITLLLPIIVMLF